MQTILSRYNPWWEGGFKPGLISREKALGILLSQINNKQIVFITGLRRVGKTALMKILISELLKKKKAAPRNILYISLDDYLLAKNNIIEIVESFRSVNKLKFSEKLYLFFDEITHKPDFELQLKNLYDSHNVKIFATSSSASLLKSKKHYLTGRHFTFEMLPLDFNEYMEFKNIKIKISDKHLLPGLFHEYLTTGGIPEYVLKGDIEYLQELVDDIIYKDIAAVHNIKNLQILKDYFLLLMERSGKLLSINKIASILKISPDTSKRYLELFSESYLIFLAERHGKTNERLLSPKKIYASDTGIRSCFTGNRDYGSLFENYVFLKIKHLNPKYIYENTTGLDFITEDKKLIEVKYHDEGLSVKQKVLFDKFKARQKFIISDPGEIDDVIILKMNKFNQFKI
ncbi:MAG: ATP-binding protein [Bacteroidia bacterium]|nr:ATP-binding protein [Bacteroidia bacterium]